MVLCRHCAKRLRWVSMSASPRPERGRHDGTLAAAPPGRLPAGGWVWSDFSLPVYDFARILRAAELMPDDEDDYWKSPGNGIPSTRPGSTPANPPRCRRCPRLPGLAPLPARCRNLTDCHRSVGRLWRGRDMFPRSRGALLRCIWLLRVDPGGGGGTSATSSESDMTDRQTDKRDVHEVGGTCRPSRCPGPLARFEVGDLLDCHT